MVTNYCIPKLFLFGADWVKLHCIAPNLPYFLFCAVFRLKVTDLIPELCYSPPDSSIACCWENHWCLEGCIANQDSDGRLCWLEGAKCDTIWSVVLEADSLVNHPKNCTWVLWNDISVVWIARVQKWSWDLPHRVQARSSFQKSGSSSEAPPFYINNWNIRYSSNLGLTQDGFTHPSLLLGTPAYTIVNLSVSTTSSFFFFLSAQWFMFVNPRNFKSLVLSL